MEVLKLEGDRITKDNALLHKIFGEVKRCQTIAHLKM
jgi:hypothetical protein